MEAALGWPVPWPGGGWLHSVRQWPWRWRRLSARRRREPPSLRHLCAAAANAALAWLGGGALAAGGGGMAAGNALLALAGPVGWTVGGLAVAGSGIYLHYRNGDLARKATQERLGVEGEIRSLRTASREIRGLGTSTRTHIDGTLDVLAWLGDNAPNDYQQFDTGQKERLAALVKHVRSLGELLRKEVAL